MDGESDAAYESFCQYLQLPKRGGTNRRYLSDLARQTGKAEQTFGRWSKGFKWEERAGAYDDYLTFTPTSIATLADQRQLAERLRADGQDFCEKAKDKLEKLEDKDWNAKQLIEFYRLGLELQTEAARIDKPKTKKDSDELNDSIRRLLNRATDRLGDVAAGGAGGTVSATERTLSFNLDGGEAEQPVRAVPVVPGELCEGDTEPALVGRPDADGAGGEPSPEGGS